MSEPGDLLSPPDPPSPDVEALRRAERRLPDPPAEIRSDVFARLQQTLDLPRPPGGGGRSGGGGGSADADEAAGAAGVGDVGRRSASARRLTRVLTTFLVGAVVGAGVHAIYDRRVAREPPPPVRVAEVDAAPTATPGPVAVTATATPSLAAPGAEAAPSDAAPPPTPAQTRSAHGRDTEVRERDRDLAAERTLIEQARTALSRGQGEAALGAIERHAHDFPRGALIEERESLLAQALVELGKYDRAREVGARFHRRFPRSIFGAVVDEALRLIP